MAGISREALPIALSSPNDSGKPSPPATLPAPFGLDCMRKFNLKLSGDLSNKPAEQVGLDVIATAPHVQYSFIEHQRPGPNEPDYHERIFSLRLRAADVVSADGIVVCTPYVQPES